MNSAVYWSAKVPCNVDTDLTCVALVESIQDDARAELLTERAQLTSKISQLDRIIAEQNERLADAAIAIKASMYQLKCDYETLRTYKNQEAYEAALRFLGEKEEK